MVKKTNVADTSIKAYNEVRSEGLLSKEERLVIGLLTKSDCPLSSRQLMYQSHKERTNITRALYCLEKKYKVMISHKAKCEYTLRMVRYYSLYKDASIS
jgi:hypothetical protein